MSSTSEAKAAIRKGIAFLVATGLVACGVYAFIAPSLGEVGETTEDVASPTPQPEPSETPCPAPVGCIAVGALGIGTTLENAGLAGYYPIVIYSGGDGCKATEVPNKKILYSGIHDALPSGTCVTVYSHGQ